MLRHLLLLALVLLASTAKGADSKPNIVLIYADDLGYGDVSAYGATRVTTPHMDRLAKDGLRFTDGHSPSATCTPSRYAMLTGEYAWRQKGTGIARGDAAAIIKPGRVTLASLLKQAGYNTGVVGKWHLGLGDGSTDWNKKVSPGPLEIGFDYCFLIPATGDRVPTAYLEGHHIVGLQPEKDDPLRVSFGKKIGNLPTGKERPDLLKMYPSHGHDMTIVNGISRIGYQMGGQSAWWKDEDMADVIAAKAVDFIDEKAAEKEPFFLFFSAHDIHVPRVPHERFVGKTPMGPRGDAIVQFDWCVGEILKKLDALEITDETLVILTSDNGPVIDDGYKDDSVKKLGDHRAAGPWRGGKYSNFEGGTRVPFVTHWPGHIEPGVSDALVCQIDFPHSLAKLAGVEEFGETAVPDSMNVLPALLGTSDDGREDLVEHARQLALRVGDWKYIPPGKGAKINQNTNTELGVDPGGQLFDLSTDPGERKNVAKEHPDRLRAMSSKLTEIREAERTRP